MEGWVVGGKGRVGDCYANAICSSSTHCSPGIHKHDVDEDYLDDTWNKDGRNKKRKQKFIFAWGRRGLPFHLGQNQHYQPPVSVQRGSFFSVSWKLDKSSGKYENILRELYAIIPPFSSSSIELIVLLQNTKDLDFPGDGQSGWAQIVADCNLAKPQISGKALK